MSKLVEADIMRNADHVVEVSSSRLQLQIKAKGLSRSVQACRRSAGLRCLDRRAVGDAALLADSNISIMGA